MVCEAFQWFVSSATEVNNFAQSSVYVILILIFNLVQYLYSHCLQYLDTFKPHDVRGNSETRKEKGNGTICGNF